MFWIQTNFPPCLGWWSKSTIFGKFGMGWTHQAVFFVKIIWFFSWILVGSQYDSLAAWVPYPGGIQTRAAPVHPGSCTAVTRQNLRWVTKIGAGSAILYQQHPRANQIPQFLENMFGVNHPGWEFYDVVIHCYPISSHFQYTTSSNFSWTCCRGQPDSPRSEAISNLCLMFSVLLIMLITCAGTWLDLVGPGFVVRPSDSSQDIDKQGEYSSKETEEYDKY